MNPDNLEQMRKKIVDSFDDDFNKKPESKENIEAERILNKYFRSKNNRKLSAGLSNNEFESNEDMPAYKNKLPEYKELWDKIKKYNLNNPNSIKFDFINPSDSNIGWKLHLNVSPDNVKAISEYLIDNGYDHKYLSGGDPEDGKIFTIYVGSFALTQNYSDNISKDLQSYLAKPKENGEIEFAAGVVGRFKGDQKDFTAYGTSGLTYIADDLRRYHNTRVQYIKDGKITESEKITQTMELNAYKKLAENYGTYFFDEKAASVHEVTKGF
jgi:hypothetical protein